MSKTIQPFGRRLKPAPNGKKYSKHPKGDPNLETLSLVTTLIQVVEGNSATITVSRTGGTTGAVAVDWTVAEVTTTPQSDTLSWAAGDGDNKSVSVLAALVTANSSGSVTLSNPRRTDGGTEQPVVGVASGLIAVLDDPGIAGTIALVTTAITVVEGNNAVITASRSNGSDGAVAVDYTVTGVTTTPQAGSLAWAAGNTTNKNATLSAGLVNANTTGAVTLSNARRTDLGSPAPLLGTSVGSLTVTDVVAPPSPVLFQDYSARDFNGEPGALAVNDDWANTVYNYVPRYAPTIPTIPVYTEAAHQTIVTSRAQLDTAIANTAIRHIFVRKGTDMHGSTLAITDKSGTQANPRWILWYDHETPANNGEAVKTLRPWDWSVGDPRRAQMPQLGFDGSSSYYYVVGLNHGKVGGSMQAMAYFEGTANNIVYFRCVGENSLFHNWNVNSATAEWIWAYQCVSHSHDEGKLQPDGEGGYAWVGGPIYSEVNCFTVVKGRHIRVVSCEGWDFSADFYHNEDGTTLDCICEDCDTYVTPKHYCNYDGTYNPNGDFWMGEAPFDVKHTNHFGSTISRVYGCRAWGFRRMSEYLVDTNPGGRHVGYGGSTPFGYSNQTVKRNFDWRWNVLEDYNHIAISMIDGHQAIEGGLEAEKHSVVRNIFYNFRKTTSNSTTLITLSYHKTEVYLNTFKDMSDTSSIGSFIGHWRGNAADPILKGHDFMGQLFINTPPITGVSSTANLAGTGENAGTHGYNCYAGTYQTPYNRVYPVGITFPDSAGLTSLGFGDFRYLRKKLTTPEIAVIPGIVPTSTTMAALGAWRVPGVGHADRIGSRPNIGVDNDY